MKQHAIVVGAGIVGLAMARALSIKGYFVTVIEKNSRAVGASIRNFGMIWPIGQPNGLLYERALQSQSIWKTICDEAKIWYKQQGSLHIANHALEAAVLQDFFEKEKAHRPVQWINKTTIEQYSKIAKTNQAIGALYSADEMVIESRDAIAAIPAYFTHKYGIRFVYNTTITNILYPKVYAGKEEWEADLIYICSGDDFQTLYPKAFQAANITKCKLQMLRMRNTHTPACMGASLCGGLSLLHYASFRTASGIPELTAYCNDAYKDYINYGIHVMVSQNHLLDYTVGDSHEYGDTLLPFDAYNINSLILDYLKGFCHIQHWDTIETWNGTYAKMKDGNTEWVATPEEGVTIVTGLGGAGMTLSFGLAEELILKEKHA